MKKEVRLLETKCVVLEMKGEKLETQYNELEEKNRELLPRVNDIVVGETFKAMYDKGTRGKCRRNNRLAALRARQKRYRGV